MTIPVNMTDPFADPAVVPSTFPSTESLRGRLVMITPRKIETVPNRQNPSAAPSERITADVSLVDGGGPVQVFKNYAPTGQYLTGPDFTGMYLSGSFMIEQLRPFVGTGRAVLGVVDTKVPGTRQGQGNPWGIMAATEEQKNQARAYLANRSVAQAAPPAAAPQNAAPVPTPAPAAAPNPAPIAPTASPVVPAPGSAPQGANPFL